MPFGETAVKLMPVGNISPFWLPPTTQSIFHSSMRKSSEPSDEIVSTSEQRRMLHGIDRRPHLGERDAHAGRGLVVHDADRLDCVRRYPRRAPSSRSAISTPWRQSAATMRTSTFSARAIFAHSSEK